MDVIPKSDMIPEDIWDVAIDDGLSLYGYRIVKIKIPLDMVGHSKVLSFWLVGLEKEWENIFEVYSHE